ncbi:IS66 family transposase [Paraburkholderia phytofirmans]
MPINVTITAEELGALLAERDAARALREEQEALRGALRLVTAERDLAQERLRAYRRELFGAKSEARDSDQPGLFNEAEALGANSAPAQEDTPETTVAAHKRKKHGHCKPLDPNLPREVVRHELPEAERFCTNDGHALVEIGAEISEQLDVIPEQLRVIQHQRVKYACPCCDLGIKVTPAPPRIIPRGLLSESALAWIATGKYQFGMPLYRQAGLLRRFGGDSSSNTIAATMVRVGLATQPVINLMRDALLETELIYCDETTFQVLKEKKGRKPQTKSYLWAQMTGSGMPIRCFSFTPGRGAKLADKLFTGIRKGAVLMTDGYEPYNEIAQRYELMHLGCWAHLRRYFIKAEENVPKAARSPDLLATRFIALEVGEVRLRMNPLGYLNRRFFMPGQIADLPSITRGGSRMPKFGTFGSIDMDARPPQRRRRQRAMVDVLPKPLETTASTELSPCVAHSSLGVSMGLTKSALGASAHSPNPLESAHALICHRRLAVAPATQYLPVAASVAGRHIDLFNGCAGAVTCAYSADCARPPRR